MQADTFHDDLVNFNSHAHVERDELAEILSDCLNDFNSHAHVERDKYWNKHVTYETNFNSHAHVERDVNVLCVRNIFQKFQLTRSRGA